jgi:hypothetical protein
VQNLHLLSLMPWSLAGFALIFVFNVNFLFAFEYGNHVKVFIKSLRKEKKIKIKKKQELMPVNKRTHLNANFFLWQNYL